LGSVLENFDVDLRNGIFLLADLDSNWSVNQADRDRLLDNMEDYQNGLLTDPEREDGDLDRDGDIDMDDLDLLDLQFGLAFAAIS
jgi:hypothetical protein